MNKSFFCALATAVLAAVALAPDADAHGRLRQLRGGGPVGFFDKTSTRPFPGQSWTDVSVNAAHGQKLCHVWVNGHYLGQHWTDGDGHWNAWVSDSLLNFCPGGRNHFRFLRPNGSINNVSKVNDIARRHHAPSRARI